MDTLTIKLPQSAPDATVRDAVTYLTRAARVIESDVLGVRLAGYRDATYGEVAVYFVTLTKRGASVLADFLNRTIDQLEADFEGQWEKLYIWAAV